MATPPKSSTKKRTKTPRLGRGLSSLMGTPVAIQPAAPTTASPEATETTSHSPEPRTRNTNAATASTPGALGATATATTPSPEDNRHLVHHLPLEKVVPNRHQPREHFDNDALNQLAASIKAEGIMQPIVVRSDKKGGYELVAGERRWRAAGIAGLATVPALVHDLDDRQMAEWALIENLQREDLNPIERAVAFQHLSDTFELSHAQVAMRVGLDRSTVTNLVRLLKLAPSVRDLVSRGTLSMGQSRALAGMADHAAQTALADQIVREGWTVRQVEDAVRQAHDAASTQGDPKPLKNTPPKAAYLQDLERQIAEQLKTKVKLKAGRKKGAGTLSIDFYSIDEFDQLMGRLGVSTE